MSNTKLEAQTCKHKRIGLTFLTGVHVFFCLLFCPSNYMFHYFLFWLFIYLFISTFGGLRCVSMLVFVSFSIYMFVYLLVDIYFYIYLLYVVLLLCLFCLFVCQSLFSVCIFWSCNFFFVFFPFKFWSIKVFSQKNVRSENWILQNFDVGMKKPLDSRLAPWSND